MRVSLNPHLAGIEVSPTLAIEARVRRLRKKGKRIYNLGLGQSPFPVPQHVVDALKRNAHQKQYLPPEGLPALREAVAAYHRREDHIAVLPENILVGPGSKELLFLLQLVFKGEVIILTPSWVSYAPQAQMLGKRVRFLSTSFAHSWRIDTDALARMLRKIRNAKRTPLLLLNYPNNPTGLTYPEDALKDIARVARAFGTVVLADEIYGRLHHNGKHVSVAHFYPEGTIVSSGLSKWCGAGGWRLGTLAFPKEFAKIRKALAAVASETYTSVSAPIQYAAVEAFQGGPAMTRYGAHVRRILKALGKESAAVLAAAGVKVHAPEGAFYLFPDFSPFRKTLARRGIVSSAQLAERLLLSCGVATLAGIDFHRSPRELTLRLSYVNFNGSRTLEASARIGLARPITRAFLQQYCKETLAAMHRIADWISRLPHP